MSSTKPKGRKPEGRAYVRPSCFSPLTPAEVRELRLSLGMSQYEFADMLMVSRITVYRWEHAPYAQQQSHIINMRRLMARITPGMEGSRARKNLGL